MSPPELHVYPVRLRRGGETFGDYISESPTVESAIAEARACFTMEGHTVTQVTVEGGVIIVWIK